MAIKRDKKLKAIELYIAGSNREQIAKDIGVAPSTVMKWYQKHIPENWDEARKAHEDKARAKIRVELEEHRVKLGTVHFKDFELIRQTWRRHGFLEPTPLMKPDDKGILRQVVDAVGEPQWEREADGKVKMRARTAFTASEIRQLSASMRDIQEGQVQIFGDAAYAGLVDAKGKVEGEPEISPEAAEMLMDALERVTEGGQEEGSLEEPDTE